jgi:hypothetical protein
LNVATMAKRLHRGCVQLVGAAVDRTRHGSVLKQEQMFDSACGSSTHNLLHICRSVARADLLVEPIQGATRKPGGHRPNKLQRLPIHFVLTKMAG